LKYKYETKVLPVEDYQNINLLYVIAPNNYDFKNSDTWEIKAGGNYIVTKIDKVNDKISLFKLTK
jgi:hypothetical protein